MHPILVGPIHTFGVLVLLGALAGMWRIRRDSTRLGLDPEATTSLAVELFLAGLVGSRIFFVVQNWHTFAAHGWLDALALWKGGLVWYGGPLAALAVLRWRMQRHGLPLLRTADVLAPGTILGLAVGRVGCLMAGDDHGRLIVTDPDVQARLMAAPGWLAAHRPVFMDHVPWYALRFTDPAALMSPDYLGKWLLPSQPLMTLKCLVIFAILVSMRRRLSERPGALAALLFVLYPIGRFLVEFTRGYAIRGYVPSTVPILGGLSTSQTISVALLPVALAAFALLLRRAPPPGLTAAANEPTGVQAIGAP